MNPHNADADQVKPITYPQRPCGGGVLPKKLELFGDWFFTPKVNGWRTLVHAPTGTMFNRKGEPLSIAKEFDIVLSKLSTKWPAIEWLDCEAFERRHPLGKGSLVILDAVVPKLTWLQRQQLIYDTLVEPGVAESWAFEQFEPEENKLLTFAYDYETVEQQHRKHKLADADLDPHAAWLRLQECNKQLDCDLFEGLVAANGDAPYPIQLQSPDQESPNLVKYRWAW